MEQRISRLEGESQISAKQLDEQRAILRERVAQVDAKVAQVDAKIAEVQKKIDELNATAHRTGADLAVNQDKLVDEMTRLRGMLEEQAHRLESRIEAIDKALAQMRAETDARFAALKGAGALEEFEARKKLDALPRPANKDDFLDLARDQESKGEKAVARVLYEEFVKKWPTDPRAADAHFRLGELWFGERRYRDAILEYGRVAQDFPRSDKAPDALLRTAESMVAIDLKDDARAILADIPKRYPGTTAAQRARARLAELSSPKKKR
jgi:tol-pal system protein YbgF